MRFDKLTAKFQQALQEGQSLALAVDSSYLETGFVLKVLLGDQNSGAAALLAHTGVNTPQVKQRLQQHLNSLPKVSGQGGDILPSRELQAVLNLMDKAATKRGDAYIANELFLLALVQQNDATGKILKEAGATEQNINAAIDTVRGGQNVNDANAEDQRGALEEYMLDLTQHARDGRFDPVIGCDDEIRRAIQVLQRRIKNNPMLIDEPGVGKTAIVEGLTQRIVNGEVPESLRNKRLLVLDLAALTAGAKYRGEFEERLKGVLNDLAKGDGNTLIFIDEIRTLVGAGRTDGAMDTGNMLKPALARSELHCIGATTLDEYRQYTEKDAALERRFQKVLVGEPSVENIVAILHGLQERYEIRHGIDITDPAIVAAAELSDRYIIDHFLPDKTVDLINGAASHIKMELDSKPGRMDKLNRRIIQFKVEKMHVARESDEASKKCLELIDEEIDGLRKEYADLDEIQRVEKAASSSTVDIKKQMDDTEVKIEQAKRQGDFARVSELEYDELPKLGAQLQAAESSPEGRKQNKLFRTEIGAGKVAEIVSRMTDIPVSKMMEGERDKLLKMEEVLHHRAVGQDEAVRTVPDATRRSRSDLADPNKPYGGSLSLGPTGVSKTELHKALAGFLSDSEDHLIRIDVSKYMEKHAVVCLIGAPPGYIGYEEGSYLTKRVRRKPYSVILLDEVERAHPDVFNILLQVLDNGRLTDGQGHTVDFKNIVIVMTSNIGSQHIQQMSTQDYEAVKEVVMEGVKEHFHPEIISRIDEVVVFHGLDQANIRNIAGIQLKGLEKRLKAQHLHLKVDDAALDLIAKAGFDPVYGTRPLKRAIQPEIENPLAKTLLEGKYTLDSTIHVKEESSELLFTQD